MSNLNTNSEDFVNVSVLVPKHLVGAVYRAIADIVEGKTPSTASTSTLGDRFQWWGKDQIVQLKQEVHNPTVLSLLNLAAQRAGEWVSYKDVYTATDRMEGQARGDLAGFTRLIKKTFPQNKEGLWPVEVSVIENQLHYRMPHDVARNWLEA
jgi:hypothetical protein